jgi:hypothetical protein
MIPPKVPPNLRQLWSSCLPIVFQEMRNRPLDEGLEGLQTRLVGLIIHLLS